LDWTSRTPIPRLKATIEAPDCQAVSILTLTAPSSQGTGTPGRAGCAVIGFKVLDRERVDELYSELTAFGYVGQQPPYDAFWGARYAIVEDPDGNPVGIMSPVDPDRRSRPDFP
jgi:catechol 2,3-dioxygenase-like lactoylglutathione lyase family enzyme